MSSILKNIVLGLLAVGLLIGLVFGISFGVQLYRQMDTPCAISNSGSTFVDSNSNGNSQVGTNPETRRVDISCVQRANFGEEIGFGTETWDSETRVWVLEDFTCEGPYCYTYDACDDPEAAIELQPFYLGYELSPVNGEKFEICHDFEGVCAR